MTMSKYKGEFDDPKFPRVDDSSSRTIERGKP